MTRAQAADMKDLLSIRIMQIETMARRLPDLSALERMPESVQALFAEVATECGVETKT